MLKNIEKELILENNLEKKTNGKSFCFCSFIYSSTLFSILFFKFKFSNSFLLLFQLIIFPSFSTNFYRFPSIPPSPIKLRLSFPPSFSCCSLLYFSLSFTALLKS